MFGTFGIAYIALASGLYHTFRDHNEKAFRTMLKLDYSGQVIMIFCVSISCLWLALKRHEELRMRVLIVLNVLNMFNFAMAWLAFCPGKCNHHT